MSTDSNAPINHGGATTAPESMAEPAANSMAEAVAEPMTESAVAVMFVDTHPDRYALSVRSLLEHTPFSIVVGTKYNSFATEFDSFEVSHPGRVSVRPMGSVSELANTVYAERRVHLVIVNDAVVLPSAPFDRALAWLRADLRVSTVSFLSNAADFLSFPTRNLATDRPPDGHDETSITRRLRSESPEAERAPIVYAAGSVVVVSSAALGAVGDIVAPASARFDIAIADFSIRARGKGFVDLVDTSTFISRPSDVAVHPIAETLTPDDRGWLLHRHQAMVAFLDHERMSGDSPLALAHQVARVKVEGLRILIDGSCFGPNEMGTQVATAQTIRSLAERADVRSVAVALPGAIPAYAAEVLTGPKVHAFVPPGGDLHAAGPVDIAFRPYQPTPGWELHRWRVAGVRLVVSVLDTIAFHNGGYFANTGDWMAYRACLLDAVRASDSVTVISLDVADQMAMHCFPIDADRVVGVPLGTEHLRGDDPTRLPNELHARGFTTGAFALCLGVNYTHKNRELAMAAHEELRGRGFDLALVQLAASPCEPGLVSLLRRGIRTRALRGSRVRHADGGRRLRPGARAHVGVARCRRSVACGRLDPACPRRRRCAVASGPRPGPPPHRDTSRRSAALQLGNDCGLPSFAVSLNPGPAPSMMSKSMNSKSVMSKSMILKSMKSTSLYHPPCSHTQSPNPLPARDPRDCQVTR